MATKKIVRKKSGKSAKEKLAAGAAKIRQAEKEAKQKKQANVPLPPLELVESKRDIKEIMSERVQVLPGSIGLLIAQDTPLEETLRIYDYVNQMQEHVGFMIGDVVNFGETTFGDKYGQAMQQTGRAKSTIKGYAEASRRIPPDQRIAALSFSHHREIVRLDNPEKRAEVLKEVGDLAKKGKAPTTKELRYKVQKMQPKKKKPAKRSTSGKGKKGGGKKIEPYVPNEDEQSTIDSAENVMEEAIAAIEDKDLQRVLLKVDNATKRHWAKLLAPFVKFEAVLDKATGY